jgi:RNA-directed DNA polymerase
LANILLDDFDKELERPDLRFVHYADDFLVFTKTSKAAASDLVTGSSGRDHELESRTCGSSASRKTKP